MPRGWTRGPQGQMRPISTGACAVHVMKIATGEIEEHVEKPPLEGTTGAFFSESDDGPPPHPVYGPGLPPPGAKTESDT